MINPSDQEYVVHLMYQGVGDKGNGIKQVYHTMGIRKDNGKEDTSNTTIPAHGRVTLVTQLDWRRKLKPDGAVFELDVDGKAQEKGKKGVPQFVLQESTAAETGFQTGSPKLTSGQYSVDATLLTVEKAALKEPLVDASMDAGFLTSGLNFLNFSFDIKSKLKPFFTSGSVGIDLPFEKIAPKISVAIDGSTSFVIGTDVGNFTSKEGGPLINWKNKDSKAISDSLTEQDKSNAFMKKIKQGYAAVALVLFISCYCLLRDYAFPCFFPYQHRMI